MTIPLFLSILSFFFIGSGCQESASAEKSKNDSAFTVKTNPVIRKDSTISPVLKPYSDIEYEKVQLLAAAPGTKSVLFNAEGSNLDALNL